MTEQEYLHFAKSLTPAAWRAGGIIMSYFGNARVELKDDSSPVTAADKESDALIVDELTALAPGITVISEESVCSPVADPGQRFFLVDPLDGTREFIEKRAEFTVNIALIEHGTPVFGLVYAPALSEIYLTLGTDQAVRGRLDPGADLPDFETMAWERLHTRSPATGGVVAAVSRSHLDDATTAFLARHAIAETISGGSSIKFCLLARGEADVYPRFGRTMEWDIAAGHAVLAAAGGVVIDENGEPLRYGKIGRNLDNPAFIAWGKKP